jgi:hypothetical protein
MQPNLTCAACQAPQTKVSFSKLKVILCLVALRLPGWFHGIFLVFILK